MKRHEIWTRDRRRPVTTTEALAEWELSVSFPHTNQGFRDACERSAAIVADGVDAVVVSPAESGYFPGVDGWRACCRGLLAKPATSERDAIENLVRMARDFESTAYLGKR